MNSRTKLTSFFIALLLALSAIGASASVALADQPVKTEGSSDFPVVLTDVCSFPVDVEAHIDFTEMDFYNKDGDLIRIYYHIVEQDRFSANGNTLVGLPFTFNLEILFDSDGNIIHNYAYGIVEKIPLPDGSLFISAGWLDFAAHPGAIFLITPDRGNPGDIEGFCAALAP